MKVFVTLNILHSSMLQSILNKFSYFSTPLATFSAFFRVVSIKKSSSSISNTTKLCTSSLKEEKFLPLLLQ